MSELYSLHGVQQACTPSLAASLEQLPVPVAGKLFLEEALSWKHLRELKHEEDCHGASHNRCLPWLSAVIRANGPTPRKVQHPTLGEDPCTTRG